MIKFVHRKHAERAKGTAKIIITYTAFEIILSVLHIFLVGFFIYNYLEYKVFKPQSAQYYVQAPIPNRIK